MAQTAMATPHLTAAEPALAVAVLLVATAGTEAEEAEGAGMGPMVAEVSAPFALQLHSAA